MSHWLFSEDCVEYLTRRKHKKVRPVDLFVCDPPYNFGQQYADYSDKKSRCQYLAWVHSWLDAVNDNLAEAGSLFIFCPEEWVSQIDVYCQDALNLSKRRQIAWAFTFGQKATRNFTRSHCHILYFAKDPKRFTFNTNAVAVPSARQLVYKDKRAAGPKPPDDVWVLLAGQLESCLVPDGDVWLQSRVCGTFKEREPHSPNQLPLPLVERIVKACSDPGGLVCDPFLGSGTSLLAAVRHGRDFLGVDVSAECVRKSKERLQREAAHDT